MDASSEDSISNGDDALVVENMAISLQSSKSFHIHGLGEWPVCGGQLDSPKITVTDKDSLVRDTAFYFGSSELSDISLVVGDKSYSSHKFVLAKSSNVFRTMLYSSVWSSQLNVKDNQILPTLTLEESEDCFDAFPSFLRFFYTAEIEFHIGNVVKLLRLADKYNVESLQRLCVAFMVNHCKSPCLKNAFSWYPWSKCLHIEDLRTQCLQTIAWHMEQLIKPDNGLIEWSAFDLDLIQDLLASDEVIVRDEFSLFMAVSRWLLEPSRSDSLAEYARALLPQIRFSQMLVGDLHRCELTELYQRNECRVLLHDLVSLGYRFRELYPRSKELGIENQFSCSTFYQPRDYLSLVVDIVQMNNTLRFGIQVDVKMYVGAVPLERKDSEWKIRYSKNQNVWHISFRCSDSALVFDDGARVQTTILICDKHENVIHVERLPSAKTMSDDKLPYVVCKRGHSIDVDLHVEYPDQSQTMVVLLKPMP